MLALVKVLCVIWVIIGCDSCCDVYEVDKDVLFFRCWTQVSACLCGFSFLNNQDGKRFYLILYIYICFNLLFLSFLMLLKVDKTEERRQFII